MRTRFLNTDYVASHSSPIEISKFLNLPVPHLPPSRLFNYYEDIILFDSPLEVSLDIERLPIDLALSKFLAEVIPQPVDVRYEEFEADRDNEGSADNEGRVESRFYKKEAETLYEEGEVENHGRFGSETLDVELSRENYGTSCHTNNFEILQFETQVLDVFSESACFSEKEEMQIFSEVLEIEHNVDMLKPGLTIQYSNEVQESVYSVEDVPVECPMEQTTHVSEDAGSVLDKTQHYYSTFPLLEVEETNLGILSNVIVADELISLLENIEPHDHEWTKTDELPVSRKDLLGYMGYDIVELHLDHCLSKHYLEAELAPLDVFQRVDIISTVDSLKINEDSACHQWASDSDSSLSANPVIFQEFEIIDVNSSHLFEIFFDTERIYGLDTCDSSFKKDMRFKFFDELIVSNELTLADDTFKSLPTPIVSDHARIRSLDTVIEEILAEVKPEPLSTAHEIYLDWHLLDKDKCSYQTYSSYQNMLAEKDMLITKFDWKPDNDGNLDFNFTFSDDELNGPITEEPRESLNVVSDGIMLDVNVNVNLMGVASSKSLEEKSPKLDNGDQLAGKNSERASLLSKSMSHFNDLDIFLNTQKANVSENVESSVKAIDSNSTICKASSGYLPAAHASTGIQIQQWVITLYKVKLSDDIVALIDNFERRYLAILQNGTDMINAPNLYSAAHDHKLLSLSKETLMDCIKKRSVHRTTLSEDETIMDFFSLCVIKQTAWYLSFFGIHAARMYINNISQGLEFFKSRLGVLQSLIEDSHGKAEREITRSHPILSVIYEILQPTNANNSLKVLIVADRVFWRPLKHLLMSMGISSSELQESYTDTNQPDGYYNGDVAKDKTDALLVSDCLLVPHDHVSASFPFNKFSMILEYGGSYGVSRISSLSPVSAALPRLHFLKVDLDNFGACKALCEGVGMAKYFDLNIVEESILFPGDNVNLQKLEELLNFVPIMDIISSENVDKVKSCCMPPPVPCASHVHESEQIQQGIWPFLERVIIVNTQNIDKDMIISRRSMYQKILAMEKGGTQVVERDLDLPVDIIISSAICLVWYDCRNIGNKATSLDEASSCLPLFIENIATDILTLLSLTFRCCILVFEGEISFLSTVMESSDGLYAAAASLEIDLQLFYSYSFESTNEIILSCIRCASKLSNYLSPKMPESETLAESFLIKFPSINPLTAHAILSEGMLIEFLECSHDSRICAIQKYHVSEESIALFSALSRYGDREDSKSIMTDCSSSVSSGPVSEKCHMKVSSDIKRQKCIASPLKVDLRTDKLLHSGPPNQLPDGIMLQFSEPCNHWMSKHSDEFDELDMPDSSFNDLFSDKQKPGEEVVINSSRFLKPYGRKNSKDPPILDEFRSSRSSLSEKLSGQNLGVATLSNVDMYLNNKSENHHDDFIGEVIDLTRSPLVDDTFSIDNVTYSYFAPELKKDSSRKPKIVRRLSFDKSGNPAFPVAAEVNSGSDIQTSVKDLRQRLQEKGDERKVLEKESMQRSTGVSKQLAFKKDLSHYGATPLSKAIGSVHPQPGSPWTIEFLNRIREKSRLRQQSLPCDAPSPVSDYSRNTSQTTKRRSPSILEFFRYQGSSSHGKIPGGKRQKQSIRSSSSSKNEGASTSFLPTWTPIDKRARQTLSFAMNGSGNQAKLVWSDDNTHCPSKKFRNHFL